MPVEMTAGPELQDRVIALIAGWAHRKPSQISADTLINSGRAGGLGVDGADADELVALLARELGWPLRDFDYDAFFGPELGINPFTLMLRWLALRKPHARRPLTVGMLIECFRRSKPRS